MGRISEGMLGNVKGAVGNVVVTKYRDQAVIRKKAVRSDSKRSMTQLVQQAKFSVAIRFILKMGKFLEISYKSKIKRLTGKNAATKDLLEKAITGAYPNFTIDYSKVRVAVNTGVPEPEAPTTV